MSCPAPLPQEDIRQTMEIEFELSYTGSCNIVSSECTGNDIGEVLRQLDALTALLKMGWHLGRKKDFDDPFIPEPEPSGEEEPVWLWSDEDSEVEPDTD